MAKKNKNKIQGPVVMGGSAAKAAPAEPLFNEITSAKLDYYMFSGWMQGLTNPGEKLFGSPDMVSGGLLVYQKMREDGHMTGIIRSRKLAVCGRDWNVLPAADAPEALAREEAEIAERMLTRCLTNTGMSELMEATLVGFQVSEILWSREGSLIVPAELRGRRPNRFRFDVDGNLLFISVTAGKEEKMPPEKFIVHTHEALNGNPYGWGDLNACFWAWWLKRHNWKFWMVFADKFGMPTVVGKYPSGASPAEQDKLLNALKTIQSETCLRMPQGFEVALLEAQRTGSTDLYDRLMNACNAELSKAILGQTMTTDDGSSLSQAKVHDDVRHDIIENDCRALESTINSQLIERIVYYNAFRTRPYLWINTDEEEDLNALADRDSKIHAMGYPVTQEYISEQYGLPIPGPGDTVLPPPAAPNLFGPAPDAARTGVRALQAAEFAEAAGIGVPALQKTADAVERLNWIADARLKQFGDRYEAVRSVIRKAIKNADSFEAVLKALKKLDVRDEMKIIIESEIRLAAMAAADLESDITGFRTTGGAPESLSFAVGEDWNWEQGITPDEALAWWSAKVPLPKSLLEEMLAGAEDRAFTVAGLENEYLLGRMKDFIGDAMAQGVQFAEWASDVDAVFQAAGVSPLKSWHLETVLRTNMNEAFRGGQAQFLGDPDVAGEFPMWRRTGIPDLRQRPEHAAEDGKTLPAGDPYFSTFWGYNCRCSFVPVAA